MLEKSRIFPINWDAYEYGISWSTNDLVKWENRMTGKVARIVTDKGFGFIHANGTDYFFHQSACPDFHELYGGENVSFEATSSPKGPRAENVRLVNNG